MTQTISLEEQLLHIGEGNGTPVEVTFENYDDYALPLGKYYQFPSIPKALMAWGVYRAQRRSVILVSERIVKTAAFISNVLNNEYLRTLVEKAVVELPREKDARIVLSGVVGWGREGIVDIFPVPIIEMYLDKSGYNLNERGIGKPVSYSWGASIADVLPHAAHIVRVHAAWLPNPERMASTITNNAYMLEQKLEKN